MARILQGSEWYEEIASRGHYESEYETILEQEAPCLFENYHWVKFRTTVFSTEYSDARRADFALIHNDYRTWWVGEVEMAHHSLEGHVVPQVRTLASAEYGLSEAEYLCGRNDLLERKKVLDMFKGEQPKVLVIVNSPVLGWAPRLSRYGARVVICQVFRSRLNRYVLRVNGEYPTDDDEVLTTAECEPLLHRLLRIHAPARLPVENGGRILLHHEGRASEWQRSDTGGLALLYSLRDHSLQAGRRYAILRLSDGTLTIR